jgi:ribosomal protein S27AE
VKFCGRCGGGSFVLISEGEAPENFSPVRDARTKLHSRSKFCGRCGFNIAQSTVCRHVRPQIWLKYQICNLFEQKKSARDAEAFSRRISNFAGAAAIL